jgi:hypothetical protein
VKRSAIRYLTINVSQMFLFAKQLQQNCDPGFLCVSHLQIKKSNDIYLLSGQWFNP